MLNAYLAWLQQLWRLHDVGKPNRAVARELGVTEGDIRHHLKAGEGQTGKLAKRLYDIRHGVRNAIYSSRLQSPKQRAYIQHLAALLGIQVPNAWLMYSKRQTGALISRLLERTFGVRELRGSANPVP